MGRLEGFFGVINRLFRAFFNANAGNPLKISAREALLISIGGGMGAALPQGLRRGLFSNEAGLGSAPNATAAS